MRKFWAYIFIGADQTGKSTIQRQIAFKMAKHPLYKQLRMNSQFPIRNPACPSHYEKIFLMNHSIQERMGTYGTIDNFFNSARFFKAVDICILSSHEDPNCFPDIERMIYRLREDCYNVAGVFFSNCWNAHSKQIATFQWDEVLWVDNENITLEDPVQRQLHIDAQLRDAGNHISEFLLRRAKQDAELHLI